METTMNDLSNLKIQFSYRSDRDNLADDFLIPCMKESILYCRAVGYFTSSSLAIAAKGVASLATRNGKMRLVASPYLEPADLNALRKAAEDPQEVLKKITIRTFGNLEDSLNRDRLNVLSWLAAAGLLEIRIAIRKGPNGEVARGIFHEKIGIFFDSHKNAISFSGSSNETAGGLQENFESIKVFTSWSSDAPRVQEEIKNFESLWENQTSGLAVIDFSEAGREILEKFRDPNNPPQGLIFNGVKSSYRKKKFVPPQELQLLPHQKSAIQAWHDAKGRGILAMATGSGKTITALWLASELSQKTPSLAVIITCPYINLVTQWAREIRAFGLEPVECYGNQSAWGNKLEREYQKLSSGLENTIAIITTNATFQGARFQEALNNKLCSNKLTHILIADEVHNLGSEKIKSVLPERISWRLGLSATPDRQYDPIGTQTVLDYFGNIIFRYSLNEAIKDGYLSKYIYHPVAVELTDEEKLKYISLTKQLGQLLAGGFSETEISLSAKNILLSRARVLASASNKIKELSSLIEQMEKKPKKALFYCGDGETEGDIPTEGIKQIDAVTRLLGEKHHLRVRKFTYCESSEERDKILKDLKEDKLDGIVAIRCLDEGIDLPELRMAFILASSTNPRQFIQRRGRVLRKFPGKDFAEIYDFFISPPIDDDSVLDRNTFNIEREILRKELIRIQEFADGALNGHQAMGSLIELRKKYNVLAIEKKISDMMSSSKVQSLIH